MSNFYRIEIYQAAFQDFNVNFVKAKKLVLLLVINCIVLSANAITKEIQESMVDENRTLDAPIELHLTSIDAPIVNSTIRLNHEDAWLFFDNIKPSDVLTDYADSIYIGTEKLKNGVNGRVAIYAHGTVIMAHGSEFKPLTVYTEDNFDGDSLQLAIHTYYNNLGEFDNKIKSFRLKRGYMVTFATNSNGSGNSRVFIADKVDLRFNMPVEYYGSVSFIRVFKHQWVTKKGWCGWNSNEIEMSDATCYYDWNVGGTTTINTEYTPIRQNGGWPSWTDINAKQNVSHLLGFNEPDRPDQANMTFQQMIDVWPGMMQSGLRIGSPAWSNPWGGNGGNLFDFINKCDELNYRVDFVALHCYWGGKSPISWYNDLKYIYETTGRPLWITEWNNGANWTTESWPDDTWELTPANAQKQLNDLKGILQVLDTAHFVERYFIYNWVEDRRAIILNGALTPAGVYYEANNSQLAFNSLRKFIVPTLSYQYVKPEKTIRLDWVNPNGDLCSEYTIEKRINNSNFEKIYTSVDMSKLYYSDTLNQETSGTISYRLKFVNILGDTLITNIVYYYQTEGVASIQTGNFQLYNTDWSTALFSKEYESEPLVMLGIPTYYNKLPLTNRINNIATNAFNFHLEPWLYMNDQSLTKKDFLSVLILPPGLYNFGDLKAEANSIENVTRDWVYVNFSEEFPEPPVVIASIVTNNSKYPLTTAIQNVTTTGFDIRLKPEEKITNLISPETVNYIAIEPGNGTIDGKLISVGRTKDGNGISKTPFEISFDSTYIEPVVFASLLTSNDAFASTLRYSLVNNKTLNLEKQREYSAVLSATKMDEIGWMVMDIESNQSGSSDIKNVKSDNSYIIFPNPAEDILFFNFTNLVNVDIFNTLGQKVLSKEVINSLNIGTLPSGIYFVKVNNNPVKRIIKK